MMTIHSANELAENVFGTPVNRLKHDFPRYIDDRGEAWIEWDEKNIRIGATEIKSGTKFTCEPLNFPFELTALDDQVEWLENAVFDKWCEENLRELGKL